jgi:hypothetical protein
MPFEPRCLARLSIKAPAGSARFESAGLVDLGKRALGRDHVAEVSGSFKAVLRTACAASLKSLTVWLNGYK